MTDDAELGALLTDHTPVELAREVLRLRLALDDISSAQPIWWGGVGRVPWESLRSLVDQMRATANEALQPKEHHQ